MADVDVRRCILFLLRTLRWRLETVLEGFSRPQRTGSRTIERNAGGRGLCTRGKEDKKQNADIMLILISKSDDIFIIPNRQSHPSHSAALGRRVTLHISQKGSS